MIAQILNIPFQLLDYSFVADDTVLKVQLQQNGIVRDEITTVTRTFPTKYSLGRKGMVIIPCSVSDVIHKGSC